MREAGKGLLLEKEKKKKEQTSAVAMLSVSGDEVLAVSKIKGLPLRGRHTGTSHLCELSI